jgi:4-hydroxy-3-methylbut-2-enyl diphosphate reductase
VLATVSLVVLCPLEIEAIAVRAALPGATVLRAGVGPERARTLQQPEAAAVAVAGVCGGIDPDLRAGDVVVPTELRDEAGSVRPVAGGALVAAALRHRGQRVVRGPIVSTARILRPAEREAMRPTGAIAVDMESFWLAEAAGDRPLAVIRVVADAAGRSVFHPSTLVWGAKAVRTLRRAAPALGDWYRITGHRSVLLAAPRSFCAGVERAIEIVERALEQRGAPIYVRKQIVHNVHVVGRLERRGAVFVEELDEVPEGATVVFSAHGVSPAVKEEAERRGLDVIDATCPLVNKVHAEARTFEKLGKTIFLVGHAGHEEVEGTTGEAPGSIRLVERREDVADLEAPDPERVAFLTQTTLGVDEAMEVVDAIRARFPALAGPRSDDICYATSNRQAALKIVADEADLVLVVGSDNSSNSKRLVEVSAREGGPAYLIDDETALEPAWLEGVETVGLTAGASAPESLVQRVIDELAGLGPVTVEERTLTEETVHFALPRKVS